MNKLNRVLLGAGAFLVMSGGLLALTGWATGADTEAMREVSVFGSSDRRTDTPIECATDLGMGPGFQEGIDLEPFSKLDVDIDLGDIYIQTGESYDVVLDWSGDHYQLTYELEGDTLKVRSSGGVNSNLAKHQATVYVYLPQDAALTELKAHAALGNLEVSDVTVQKAELSGDLGDINGYGLTAGELTVQCSLGGIFLADGSADTAEITNNMGDIEVVECDTASALTVRADLGSVDLQGDFRGEVDVTSNMGGITLNLAEPESAYSYDLEVDMGELYINGASSRRSASGSGSPHTLTAEADMGDINLWFDEVD